MSRYTGLKWALHVSRRNKLPADGSRDGYECNGHDLTFLREYPQIYTGNPQNISAAIPLCTVRVTSEPLLMGLTPTITSWKTRNLPVSSCATLATRDTA